MERKYKEIFSSSYPNDLEPIVELLRLNGISYKVIAPGTAFDPNFTFLHSADAVQLMVLEEDFEAARRVLVENDFIGDLSEEDGYRAMLGQMEDEELEEMVVNHNAYAVDQSQMARKILAERGIVLDEEEIEDERNELAAAQRVPSDIGFAGKTLIAIISFALPPVGFVISLAILLLKGKDAIGNYFGFYGKSTKNFAWIALAISLAMILALLFIDLKTSMLMRDWW